MNFTKPISEQKLRAYIATHIINRDSWTSISIYQHLSESFIEDNNDLVDWFKISRYQKLSKSFIEKHKDLVNWNLISQYQKLSEKFIEDHKDLVNWTCISIYQHLSESFIAKYKDLVDWDYISKYQKLSESFIAKYKDLVDWLFISKYQKLSESFIEEHKKLVSWTCISINQKLNESFIEEHKDLVNLDYISKYQKLSEEFRFKYNLKIPTKNWVYVDPDERLKKVKETGLYEIEGDYVIAFKGIRSDRYSAFNFQYQYFVGGTYESNADFNIDEENSFGLSAWTLEEAREYCNELIIKVKIHKSDLAALVHEGNKIRCTKFTVLEDII